MVLSWRYATNFATLQPHLLKCRSWFLFSPCLPYRKPLFHTAFPHSLPGIDLRRWPTPPPSHPWGILGCSVTFSKLYPPAANFNVWCISHIFRHCETNLKLFILSNQSANSTAWLEKLWLPSRPSIEIAVCFRETLPNWAARGALTFAIACVWIRIHGYAQQDGAYWLVVHLFPTLILKAESRLNDVLAWHALLGN